MRKEVEFEPTHPKISVLVFGDNGKSRKFNMYYGRRLLEITVSDSDETKFAQFQSELLERHPEMRTEIEQIINDIELREMAKK